MKLANAGLLACSVWSLCSLGASAWAQGAPIGGIYTCVDAQGRKLTADRPIPECSDREQKVLNPSGTLKQKIGPTLTAAERAQQEAREKRELEERNRVAEERRRDRALLVRAPNQAAHDKQRSEALAQLAALGQAANVRLTELTKQRKRLDEEMEFYKKNPEKAPQNLRRQIEEINQNMAAQQRAISDQEAESQRVNARFDEELLRLRQLWAGPASK